MNQSTAEIRTYFEKLAISHKKIAHSKLKKGFFGYDLDEFNEVGQRTRISEFPMILSEIKPNFYRQSDSLWPIYAIHFIVLHQPVANNRDHESEYNSFDLAYQVGTEVLAKIVEDSRNGQCPKIFDRFKGDAHAKMVGPYATRHVGWAFSIQIKSRESIEFNSEAWQ